MTWSLRRAATLAAAAAAFVGAPALPAAAQTADAPATTASSAPDDAQETAARRRPVRRFRARLTPTPRSEARRDSVPVRTVSTRSESEVLRLSRLDNSLRDAAPRWLGIPYRWGGTTRRGIDCSSFVQQYVRETLAIELPRTTASQRYEGVPIDRDQLQSGDLVFFRRRGVRHVGVYLSDGEFIHASSSRGVTVSSLSDSYWDRYYWMSRRILSEPSGRMPTPRSDARARG